MYISDLNFHFPREYVINYERLTPLFEFYELNDIDLTLIIFLPFKYQFYI